jgi:hypothetical protein
LARVPIKRLGEKEGIAAILFLAFCLALALGLPAGVGTGSQAPAVARAVAPWIFGPFQVLLLYLPPGIGALLIPALIMGGIAGLPWLVRVSGEQWGRRIFLALISLVVVLLIWFAAQEYGWVQ